jgi:hypothetical protein
MMYDSEGELIAIAVVHADDIKAAADEELISTIISDLGELLNITVDYEPTKYLGLDFRQDDDMSIHVSARSKLEQLAAEWDINRANGPKIPRPAGTVRKPREPDETPAIQVDYQSLVGSLLWISLMVFHHCLYAVVCLTSHSHDPGMSHFQLAKVVLRYMYTHRDYELVVAPKWRLVTCTDASHTDATGFRSSHSYFTYWGTYDTFTLATTSVISTLKHEVVQRSLACFD